MPTIEPPPPPPHTHTSRHVPSVLGVLKGWEALQHQGKTAWGQWADAAVEQHGTSAPKYAGAVGAKLVKAPWAVGERCAKPATLGALRRVRLGLGSPSWWNQSWFYNPF